MSFLGRGLQEGNKFVAMLQAHAAAAREATIALQESLEHPGTSAVERLRTLAAAAADRRRVLVDELHDTFVTPLDREDIYNLSHSLERMVNYALTTIEEVHLLQVEADEPIRRMVGLVREQAESLEAAMQRLPKNPRVADDHADHVHEKEREVERVYRDAIRELFARATDMATLPRVLYRREVYRHISNMADRAASAANVLGMIVMKIA
jgi:uncharacterized protein Yka (UPF0111/DUF47 family)